uniref:Uncharacterized protein n=1 Tax=Molossus molossus TaxID=27622 RepID=A0A7J8J0J0_MOLMO|nr:hypothetical protein HJG59_010323 [Molossus molossus]
MQQFLLNVNTTDSYLKLKSVSAPRPKPPRFDPSQGHAPWLQLGPQPWLGWCRSQSSGIIFAALKLSVNLLFIMINLTNVLISYPLPTHLSAYLIHLLQIKETIIFLLCPNNSLLTKTTLALASLAQRLEHRPAVRRDPGSVSAKGTCLSCSLSPALVGCVGGSHSMCPFHVDVSLSLSSSLSLPLYLNKKWKNVLG